MLTSQQLFELGEMYAMQANPPNFCIDPGYLDRELTPGELEQIGLQAWATYYPAMIITVPTIQKIYIRTALINNMGVYTSKWAEIPIIPLN